MAGVQGSALAIAVSNAGGLGSLPGGMLTPEELRKELAKVKAGTGKPFNVNFFCHVPPQPDSAREAKWKEALLPYYSEFGIYPKDIPVGAGRVPFNEETADMLEEFQPPVVSFHFGLPSADNLEKVRKWQPKILSTATTIEEAKWLEEQGVDGVIAQGLEAGGHRGNFLSNDLTRQSNTFELLERMAEVLEVPVIAAGGIADAHDIRAAMSMGASAVQIGTTYLLCPEASTSAVHRRAIKCAKESKEAEITALTNLFSGRPARGIQNRLMHELGPISSLAPEYPLATAALAPLRAEAESVGLSDFSPLWAGQNLSGCKAISASELTQELASAFIELN